MDNAASYTQLATSLVDGSVDMLSVLAMEAQPETRALEDSNIDKAYAYQKLSGGEEAVAAAAKTSKASEFALAKQRARNETSLAEMEAKAAAAAKAESKEFFAVTKPVPSRRTFGDVLSNVGSVFAGAFAPKKSADPARDGYTAV